MALIKNRATGVTRDDSGAFTGSQTQVSTMMRVVSEQEFDRIETQINAANALIDSLRAAINNQSLVMKTTLVEKIELILDKYQRATAPKLTSAQVLAVFEQTRKLYDAWVSSLSADEFHMTYEAWIHRELSKLECGVKPVQELREISKTGALDEFYQPLAPQDNGQGWYPGRTDRT